jgi:hypothetical protein
MTARTVAGSYPAAAEALRPRKHSRQYTGLPWVGLNGTVVSRPHCEQTVIVSTLPEPADPPCRFPLHVLQRLGSFLKFLSEKKCCSPAVKTNSAPQSEHFRTRSWNSAITLASSNGLQRTGTYPVRLWLLDFPACLFPVSLTGQRLLDPLLLTRLQIKGVPLDLLNNVLLLDLAFEAA